MMYAIEKVLWNNCVSVPKAIEWTDIAWIWLRLAHQTLQRYTTAHTTHATLNVNKITEQYLVTLVKQM